MMMMMIMMMMMKGKEFHTYTSANGESDSTLSRRDNGGFDELTNRGIFQRNHVTLQNAV